MRTVDEMELFEAYLKAFETKSFALTAQNLNISRAAVTRRVAKLEKMLGSELFVRENDGVEPTSFGKNIHAGVERLIYDYEALCTPAVKNVANSSKGTTVHVSAPSAIGNGLLLRWITEFQNDHPDVIVDLTLTLGPVRMMGPGCDIRINHGLFPLERALTRPLGSMRRIMVASAGYLAKHGCPQHPDDLAQHFLLGGNDLLNGKPLIVTKGSERILVPYHPRLRLKDHSAARTAALLGAGIDVHAFTYDTMPFVRSGKLVRVLQDWEPETTPVSMLLPATRVISPIAEQLADFIENKWRMHPDLLTTPTGSIL